MGKHLISVHYMYKQSTINYCSEHCKATLDCLFASNSLEFRFLHESQGESLSIPSVVEIHREINAIISCEE